MGNKKQFDFKAPIIEFDERYLNLLEDISKLEHYGSYLSDDINSFNGNLIAFSEYEQPLPLLKNDYFNEETSDFQSDFFLDLSDEIKVLNNILEDFNATIEDEFTYAKVFCPYTDKLIKQYKVNEFRQRKAMNELRILDKSSNAYCYIEYYTLGTLNTHYIT